MRKAAHLMVSSLAGSLALVTCKEPLRVSIGNHVRSLLGQANVEASAMDQVVQSCATDNLELGCMLIEKAATEKAMRDIDEALSPAIQHRRKHREQSGQPFFDMAVLGNSRYPGALPEPLRPKPGGLLPHQLEVYEAFQRTPRTGTRAPTTGQPVQSAVGPGTSVSTPTAAQPTPQQPPPPPKQPDATPSLQQVHEAFDQLAQRLETAIQTLVMQTPGREVALAMLTPESEIPTVMRDIMMLPRKLQPPSREDIAIRAAQAIFKMMYDNTTSELIRLEALVTILEGLSETCAKIKQDLVSWLSYVHVGEVSSTRRG